VFFFWYLGFFDTLYVIEKEEGPYKIVYQPVSLYEDPKVVQNKLFKELNKIGINSEKTVAIYYSEFDSTMADIAGCIVEKEDYEKLKLFDDIFIIYEHDYNVRLVADFPYLNNFSVVGGAYRVRYEFKKYCERNQYKYLPIIEIYDSSQKRIFYVMDIESKHQ
jgi:hypothetical protein